MPADDQVTSPTGVGPAAAGQNGAIAFATTHWSVVLTAQGRSAAADQALEKLCRTYWWPLYGFVRRSGYKPEEAQDLTQGFFALLLERRDLDVVRREKGRLRSYLLVSLKNFLAKSKRRELTTTVGTDVVGTGIDAVRERISVWRQFKTLRWVKGISFR